MVKKGLSDRRISETKKLHTRHVSLRKRPTAEAAISFMHWRLDCGSKGTAEDGQKSSGTRAR